jgi:hypothetical protein
MRKGTATQEHRSALTNQLLPALDPDRDYMASKVIGWDGRKLKTVP